MDSSVSPKDEIWFLRVCHVIHLTAVYCSQVYDVAETLYCLQLEYVLKPSASALDFRARAASHLRAALKSRNAVEELSCAETDCRLLPERIFHLAY